MSFFNFGDSPDRSAADTSFAFNFSGNGDVGGHRVNKDEMEVSSKPTFGRDWTTEDSKVVFETDVTAPVLKKTKVEKPSPAKRSPEKVQEKVYHHEGQSSRAVDTRGTTDDIKDVITTEEDNKHNVDLEETMKDCIDDIRREISTFLPALQAQKVLNKFKS